MKLDSIIAHRVKGKMKIRGLTQAELSRRSRTPNSTMSEIINSRTTKPEVYTMYRIAKALNCKIEDLII